MTRKPTRILMVEDNLIDQMIFQQFVQESGLPYQCTIVDSVASTEQVLNSQVFDIVLVDYLLGDGNAFDIIHRIKNIPIIVITGAGDEEIAIKAMKNGAYDYIVKDMDRNYLKVLPLTVNNAIMFKESEKLSRLLMHAIMNVNDSIFITDLNGKIIFVNRMFCSTYKYPESEILGETSQVIWVHRDENDNIVRLLSTSADVEWRGEVLHNRKDGSRFPVSLSCSIIRDDKGNRIALASVARDITEQKAMDQERETLIFNLKEALDKVRAFSGLLPICVSCRKVRDDGGYWRQIEEFLRMHSDTEFSHSICPDCLQNLDPNGDAE